MRKKGAKKDLKSLNSLVKEHKWKEIPQKLCNRRRIRKVSHAERDNNFCYDEGKISDVLPRIVVYTCITGGYDRLMKPMVFPKNIDYVAFLDEDVSTSGWEVRRLPKQAGQIANNILRNRYMKFHPYEVFGGDYDYAIYIDGNITVVGDLTPMVYAINEKTGLALHRHRQRDSLYAEAKVCEWLGKGDKEKLRAQTRQYQEEGFPKDFGLYECNVIVSDLKNKIGKEILDSWWDEFVESGSLRDQIALPYVLWKKGFNFGDIGSLGENVYRNPLVFLDKKIHQGVKDGD